MYGIPAADFDDGRVQPTIRDTLPFRPMLPLGRLVTGATASASGDTVIVRTYAEVYWFRHEGDRLQQIGEPCLLGAMEPQGEGVEVLEGGDLLLTSERVGGRPAIMTRVRCGRSGGRLENG